MRKLVWVFAAFSFVCGAVAAKADECAKLRGFDIALTPVTDAYLMPLGMADTQRQFLLELGSAFTKMDEAIAAELKLATKPVPLGLHISDSVGPFTTIAIVPKLTLGPVNRGKMDVLIGAHRSEWGPAASGVAGTNVFYGLDIELDLAHNRLGLYLPRENCAFEPFWPAVEWGSGDFKIAPTGAFFLPMYLDDKKLIVTLDTGAERTYMPFETARMLFGIEANDPRLVPAGFRAPGEAVYRFAFKTLSGGNNVTVTTPEIYIVGNQQTCGGIRDQRFLNEPWTNKCFGGGDLQLGVNLLKKLHFFFTFKDKKAYFTLAEPPVQK